MKEIFWKRAKRVSETSKYEAEQAVLRADEQRRREKIESLVVARQATVDPQTRNELERQIRHEANNYAQAQGKPYMREWN